MFRGSSLSVVLIALMAALLAPRAYALAGEAPPTRLRGDAKAAVAVTLQPNSYQSFFVDLPSNVATLRATTTGASGNVDLFVRPGTPHAAASLQGLASESAYSATTAGGNETIDASRGSAPALHPGRWFITPANTTAATVTLTLDVTFTTQGAPFQITAGMSGAWFDPDKVFQGFFFEVLDPTTALATWFTYTPTGAQAYMIGVGRITGDRVEITELVKTRGARFGDAFDAADVVREDWGDLTFTFDACGRGYAAYLPSQAAAQQNWPQEALDLERLTSIAGLACPSAASTKLLLGGTSGAWFDPNRSGEGWLVEVLNPTTAFVYWFSYTPTGEQAWFGNIGTIVDGGIRIAEAIQPTGGRFGPAYDPAQVTLQPWGEYALTFTGCNSAVMGALGPPAYGAYGSSNIARLTALAGTTCAFGAPPFTLSGSARASSNMHADGDPNNPETPNRDNDTPAQEQTLVNPAIVAGFLAATPTGVAGDRFESTTDLFDVYTVTLAQGQMVRLAVSDHDAAAPAAIDFDLFLFPPNDASQPLASSEGTGATEQIVAPSSGQFDIVLLAFRGKGNYVLTIDNVAAAAQTFEGAMSSLHEMMPEEVVVDWDDSDGTADVRAKSAAVGVDLLAGSAGRPVLVSTRGAKSRGLLDVGESPFVDGSGPKGAAWGMSDPKTRAAHDVIRHVKALRGVPGVRFAEPNHIARIKAVPNDPLYRLQWHYPMISLPQAWDITTGSRNVTVAVIDTGIVDHRDFGANLRNDLGFDFIRSPSISVDGGGIDSNATDPGDREEADGSSSFHGTHVSGTVGALGNNGTDVSGVAWSVNLMPLRALGKGGGTDYDIAQSIRFAAGLANDSGTVPSVRADVINMSLGGLAPCTGTYTAAINAARNAGVVIVAAAGNENTSQQSTPANCAGVVSVAATDLVGQRAPYSNFGSTIDVAAPGGDASEDRDSNGVPDGVISTHATDETGAIVTNVQLLNGTSMASPHVAGVVALMKSVAPAMTPAQFDSLLASGVITRDLANNGATVRDDTYGFGLIDAFRAVGEARRLATNQQLPPAIGATPVALDFGETLTTAVVTVANVGQGTLTISGVTTTQPFVRVTPAQVDAQGLGTYTVTVDRSGLANASYQGQVRFASNGGTAAVPVGFRVGAEQLFGDVGTLYTVLVDPVTFGAAYGASSNSAAGSYPFQIAGVLPGFYIVYAGTDIDNDGFICDEGEACGAFLTLADASVLELRSTTTLTAFPVLADTSLLGMVTASNTAYVPSRGLAIRRGR